MSVLNKEDLKRHVGHTLECVSYGDDVNVAVECIDCSEVLYDEQENLSENKDVACHMCGWEGKENDLYSGAEDSEEEYCPNCDKTGYIKELLKIEDLKITGIEVKAESVSIRCSGCDEYVCSEDCNL